ncbi:hypothetical protein F511_47456 [Dorcoceras hygrometricum]|uniref:Uncharacterized protein n=1 Tax=Dorcoceras hygrometricum TaxID=472368 RepID=A0A2Z6ZRJ5_9LAMI|nr:hypothetical protein F511_47456 [Dorcoceras hygrometricum]
MSADARAGRALAAREAAECCAGRRSAVARWMAHYRRSLAGRRALVARPCFALGATLREGARPTSHLMRRACGRYRTRSSWWRRRRPAAAPAKLR